MHEFKTAAQLVKKILSGLQAITPYPIPDVPQPHYKRLNDDGWIWQFPACDSHVETIIYSFPHDGRLADWVPPVEMLTCPACLPCPCKVICTSAGGRLVSERKIDQAT